MKRDAEQDSPHDLDDLVAFLDGEVDAETQQHIESRLAQDPQLAQRVREHQRAWDLLDELPRVEVADDFAQTTLEMVAVSASHGTQDLTRKSGRGRMWLGAAAMASLLTSSLAGFWIASAELHQENRELLNDLPVIENLQALQQIEDVEFLIALENEGLFVAEISDEP